MNNFESKKKIGILLMFVGGIIGLISFIFAFQAKIGLFLLVLILGVAIIILGNNQREKSIEEEYQKKQREQQIILEKEKNQVLSDNNLEEVKINKDFLVKYGISFLEFKEKYGNANDFSNEYVIVQRSAKYMMRKIQLNNIEFLFIYHFLDSSFSKVEKVIFEPWNISNYNVYKTMEINEFDDIIIPFDSLEYVNFVENKKTTTIGKKPSSMTLSIHEGLFGTAAAINKAQNSVKTFEHNDSYIEFVFSESVKMSGLIYPTPNTTYLTGLMKEIWNKKEISKIRDRAIIQNKKENDVNNFDKLRELKALMDDGIITKEEFEIKKKELLGL